MERTLWPQFIPQRTCGAFTETKRCKPWQSEYAFTGIPFPVQTPRRGSFYLSKSEWTRGRSTHASRSSSTYINNTSARGPREKVVWVLAPYTPHLVPLTMRCAKTGRRVRAFPDRYRTQACWSSLQLAIIAELVTYPGCGCVQSGTNSWAIYMSSAVSFLNTAPDISVAYVFGCPMVVDATL